MKAQVQVMSSQTASMRRATRGLSSAVVGLAVLTAALFTALPAAAHNTVIDSTPGEGETLTELPDQFIVTTSDSLLEASAAMQVTDAAGLHYGDGCVTIDGPSITTAASLGAPGDYSLTWQAVSADGHTISGVIPFAWDPTDAADAAAGASEPPVCGEEPVLPSEPSDAVDDSDDAGAEASASPSPSTEGDAETDGPDMFFPLILGGVIVVIIAVGVILLLTRRRDS